MPDIAPGASATVTVTLTAPGTASGALRVNAVYTAADGRRAHYGTVVTAPVSTVTGTVVGTPPTRDVVANPYRVGETLPYTLRVTSSSQTAADMVPTGSNLEVGFAPPSRPNYHWLGLAAGGAYNCYPSHVLTAEDIARGWFLPTATFQVTATGDTSNTRTLSLGATLVPLRDPAAVEATASIEGSRADAGRDLAANPYAVGEQVPYQFRVTSTSPFATTVAPTAGDLRPLVPPGSGNCRWSNLAAFGSYTCTTPRHPVTQEERDRGFFWATSTWSVTATGRRASTYEVDGGEVDVVVRAPALAGAQSVELVDANGDRYASVGEQVVVTTTVGNPGNVALDDLDAAAAGIDQHTLAIGASVTGQRSITLTQADLDAGRVNVPALDATATNGEKPMATTIEAVEFALDVKPPKPTTEPPLVRVDWDTMTPAIDLGTARKYSRGATVTLHGLEYGQWYYLHLAKDGQRIGWFFPELDDTITFVLPADVPNGATAVTVLDASGELVSFAKIVVNPR